MKPVVYFDYTCGDSHRLKLLLDRLGLDVEWKTFSLKENKRHEDEPSLLEGEEISSISVWALALSHAVRGLDFDRYHSTVFDGFHEEGRRLTTDEILGVAEQAGVDPEEFRRYEGEWLRRVASEHRGAVEKLGVFGTPTVLFPDGGKLYVELAHVPETLETAKEVWSLMEQVASRTEIEQLERA